MSKFFVRDDLPNLVMTVNDGNLTPDMLKHLAGMPCQRLFETM